MSSVDDLESPTRGSANTSPEAHSRRVSGDIEVNGSNGQRQIKKRNRIPVSCNECRRRKLRCDRNDPCSACVQRGDAASCKFTEPLSAQPKSRGPKPGSRDFLQQRIHRLEALVTDLAAQVRHNSNSPPSHTDSSQSPEQRTIDQSDSSSHTSPTNMNDSEPIDDLKIAMGDMKISSTGKVTYTSGNSWNTILDEIADIKLAMNPIYSSYSQHTNTVSTSPHRPSSFPFFATQTPTIADLLALLPSRMDTELLVHKFLTNMLTMCPCLHRPTFLKQLAEFYAAPDNADPIFLATLFSALACGISVYTEDDTPTRNALLQKGVASKKEMAIVWRDASMQAFCLGGFLTNTSLENLQGLILLHTFLYNFHQAYSLGWPLYGMIVSIALNMGLHRDGALFNLDPFETEMRRRLWSILVMIDGLNASSYGRPMMISDSQFDTKSLSNMNDADLRPGCKIPPPESLDPNSMTDTTYATCKYRLSLKVRKIISSLFGLTPPNYDTIMKLDAEVRETYDSFPEMIKFQSGQQPPSVTICVQRIGLRIIMNHTLVILHRPFLYRSFRDARYHPSRQRCLAASHEVLELFHEYRNNLTYIEYSWYSMGALHAFHAGTVVGLRCYLEPLTCDERDWIAVEQARAEFERVSKVDGWSMLGTKAVKVFGILIRKALEKKAILESSLGVTIGPTVTASDTEPQSIGTGTTSSMEQFSVDTTGGSSSTGLTPLYSGPLFGTPQPQFDMNPLTNPNSLAGAETFNPSRGLQGAGMPGVAAADSSPPQANWDAYWPKGMNLSEWDLFFDNMDVDFSNSDSSAGSGSTGVFADPAFGKSNRPMDWNFGNNFGNGGGI